MAFVLAFDSWCNISMDLIFFNISSFVNKICEIITTKKSLAWNSNWLATKYTNTQISIDFHHKFCLKKIKFINQQNQNLCTKLHKKVNWKNTVIVGQNKFTSEMPMKQCHVQTFKWMELRKKTSNNHSHHFWEVPTTSWNYCRFLKFLPLFEIHTAPRNSYHAYQSYS